MPTRDDPVRLALGGLVALAAAMGVGRFVYTPLLPMMAADLGLSGSTAGLVASANFLGYVAGAFAAGYPGLKGSRRAWMMGALAISASTTGLMGLAPSLAPWLVLRFAGGVASAFVLVFASTLVLDRLRRLQRPGLSTVHFAGVGTGIAVSAAFVSAGAAAGLGWRGLWMACGVISVLALGAVWRLVPDAEGGVAPAAVTAGPRRPGALAMSVAYGLFGFGYVVTATFLVLIVRGTPAVSALEPMIWLVVGVAAIPSVALWTALARRTGLALAFAVACVVEAVGVGSSVLWPTAPGIVLAAALLGGTFMGLTALGIGAARALAVGDPRTLTAVMTASFGIGQMIGPLVGGFLSDRSGSFVQASLVAAAALVGAAGLALHVRRVAAI
ncbi:YbfB/YjiJ family MFS transporter [uncultured Alsobacter sp.]|uniref:YbfB/YjiJ family MFS transporter n=1 Tax=uncultured Alsobacter sp. TaxID=1748258 RepID=UPI0025E581A0|nr:YbfB/YjiJ family MFS transporter [uncultured Alsobacter sp.]